MPINIVLPSNLGQKQQPKWTPQIVQQFESSEGTLVLVDIDYKCFQKTSSERVQLAKMKADWKRKMRAKFGKDWTAKSSNRVHRVHGRMMNYGVLTS